MYPYTTNSDPEPQGDDLWTPRQSYGWADLSLFIVTEEDWQIGDRSRSDNCSKDNIRVGPNGSWVNLSVFLEPHDPNWQIGDKAVENDK